MTTGTLHTVVNPATEQAVADVPLASVAETDALVERAHAAFPAWRDVRAGGAGPAAAPLRVRRRRPRRGARPS